MRNLMLRLAVVFGCLFLVLPLAAQDGAGGPPLKGKVEMQLAEDYPYLDALYKHLHTHPELSTMEVRTAERMAKELRSIGFEVTENVGKTGIVGVFKNGNGPT